MLRKIGLHATILSLLCASVACNESSSNDIETAYSSTQVKSFSLRNNSDILNNLDSVFFSIDLVNARIFNADSLPVGTKTNRMLVDLTTDGCSTVELHFPREGKTDSIVNYLTNPDDSIDFSLGPVKLHVVSFDKVASRDYYIQINVHKMVSDSLTWNLDDPMPLPTTLATVTSQRTVQFGTDFYTFTTDAGQNACVNVAPMPSHAGVTSTFTFPFTPVINTMTATSTSLYVLANDGTLYSSGDGKTWTSCGVKWKSITAPYGATLLGLAEVNGVLTHVTYPAGATSAAASNFPVSGNSQAIRYSTDWSASSQVITVGGTAADGSITPTAWAYDGNRWACINSKIPMETSGATVFPYYCCLTDTNRWIATTKSVLVAMGGRMSATAMQDSVYISYDLGFNWAKAPNVMQLSKDFPSLEGAQTYVVNEEQHSRAIKPITEWDTPFIYMYGGRDINGNVSRRVYRGVINRLEFKPLQ